MLEGGGEGGGTARGRGEEPRSFPEYHLEVLYISCNHEHMYMKYTLGLTRSTENKERNKEDMSR